MNNLKVFSTGTDLTGKEGYAVKLDGSGNVIQVASATADVGVGVIRQGNKDGLATGNTAEVAMPGSKSPVMISGAVKRGQYGKLAADGSFVASAFATGDMIMAQFDQDGVSGDLVNADILPLHKCP